MPWANPRPATLTMAADMDVFAGMSADEVRAELSGLAARPMDKGDCVEPDDGVAAILVTAGRLALDVGGGARERRTIGVTEEGEILFTQRPVWAEAPEATLRALTRSEIIPVDGARLERWLGHPACSRDFFAALNSQLAHREAALAIALEPRVEQRLLLKLRQLGQRWGQMTPEGIRLDLRLTHQDLADMVAAARESVTLAMGRLVEAGEITVEEQRILIRRP
jgi:CRP-like cAMP-binding protein